MNNCSGPKKKLVHDVVHVNYTHINIEKNVITNFAKWWTGSKTTSLKVMNNDANQSCFISTFVKKKKNHNHHSDIANGPSNVLSEK
jgi:hypothetical protein